LNTPDSIIIKEKHKIRMSIKTTGCIFIYILYNLKKYVTKAAAVIHHQKTWACFCLSLSMNFNSSILSFSILVLVASISAQAFLPYFLIASSFRLAIFN